MVVTYRYDQSPATNVRTLDGSAGQEAESGPVVDATARLDLDRVDLDRVLGQSSVYLPCDRAAHQIEIESLGGGLDVVSYTCHGHLQQQVWLADMTRVVLDTSTETGLAAALSRIRQDRATEVWASDRFFGVRGGDRGVAISGQEADGRPVARVVVQPAPPTSRPAFDPSAVDLARIHRCRSGHVRGGEPWRVRAHQEERGLVLTWDGTVGQDPACR